MHKSKVNKSVYLNFNIEILKKNDIQQFNISHIKQNKIIISARQEINVY